MRELGCPVILGNWDSWSIDGFPPADDPVGIMLYEIGRWWAEQADRRRPRVRAHVRADARGAARERLDGALLPRLAALVLGLDLRDDARRRASGRCSTAARAPVLVGGHTHLQMLRRFGQSVIVNPGSVGQPFSQWWPQRDPRRPLGRVRRDRQRRTAASRSTSSACRTTSRRCSSCCARATCRTAPGGSTPGTPASVSALAGVSGVAESPHETAVRPPPAALLDVCAARRSSVARAATGSSAGWLGDRRHRYGRISWLSPNSCQR